MIAYMAEYRNEIERFIYEICYSPMWEGINSYMALHPSCAKSPFSRVIVPTSAVLQDMIVEFISAVTIDEDFLRFKAVVSGTVYLEEDGGWGEQYSSESNEWLSVKCEVRVEETIKKFAVTSVSLYKNNEANVFDGVPASKNAVPIIKKTDLDYEAEEFLNKYCKEALQAPMCVPIADIIENQMHLTVYNGYRITKDFDILGQICFSKCSVPVLDFLTDDESVIEAQRGTIFIDACTYMERNVGAMNNTLAHEAFHWHRHRIYAAIKQILQGNKVIACRCPPENAYPGENESWTDEQRMEWQANNVAPRILMPLHMFKQKVDELYAQYDFENTPLKIAVLTCIAQDLAEFFAVSRQSAIIRMIETGYPEARMIYNYDDTWKMFVTPSEVFLEYSTNPEFTELLDSGSFKYVEGYIVVNDEKYVSRSEDGKYRLTEYAWENLKECCLQFTLKKYNSEKHHDFPYEIFHRNNGNNDPTVPQYERDNNSAVLNMSAELIAKRDAFEKQHAKHKISVGEETCWEAIMKLINGLGMSKAHFCYATNLGEEVYRKAEKGVGVPKLRTIVAIACGLDLDLSTTEHLLQLAGHAFDNSQESQALKFCITGYAGATIDERNEFLESYGYKPLGTKERM